MLKQDTSIVVMDDNANRPLLSRKTTRVAVSSPRKSPGKNGGVPKTSHLGLTMPARHSTSRHKQIKQFDPEEDYNYDSTDDEKEENIPATNRSKQQSKEPPKPPDKGAVIYQKICNKYGKVAISNVLKQFGRSVISLDGLNLSRRELKAFFISLVESYVNKDVVNETDKDKNLKQLQLSGNKLGQRELDYLMDFSSVHIPLISVLLNGCHICSNGLQNLSNFTRSNKTLRKLDLSENNLTDNEGSFIADMIEYGENIKELILRRNKLAECGTVIGEALVNNDTLILLDLSWNHIRGNGAIGLCKGLKSNKGLETLNVAWNGFGYEGAVAMSYALAENSTLQSLDLSSNRIHPPALFELIKGLEKNKTLSSLKLGNNPITANMTSVMLMAIFKHKESNLKELDLEGVVVDKDFRETLQQLQDERLFIVRYDAALPLCKGSLAQIERKNIFNIDPIRILYYMKEHLRTIDLFLKVDRDGNNSLSKEEMKFAFEREGFPISDTALETVMGYLDTNKDGEVDLIEFINGERRLKRQLIKEHEDELIAEKEKDLKFSQSFTAKKTPRKLPPLNGPKMS